MTMADNKFEPGSLTVAPGTTVTWTNEDNFAHTVTAEEGAPASFDSGDLEGDATFEQTFEKAGTYPYVCEIHPAMSGEVVVEG